MLQATIRALSPRPLEDANSPEGIDDTLRTSIKLAAMTAVARFNNSNVHLLFRAALKIIKQRRSGGNSVVDVTKNVDELVKNFRCLNSLAVKHPG
jgi:hypothetical protein